MEIKDLIKKLNELPKDRTIYLNDNGTLFDFTGFSVDDNNDVELYVSGEDKEA